MKLNQNKIKYLVLFLSVLIFSSFSIHKYYIGVYEVNYFKEKKAIQITSRIFIDDFEKALHKIHNKHIYLSTKQEIKEANDYVFDYLQENLKIKVNNKSQKFVFIAKEKEEDVMVCYFKINFSGKIKSIEISNDVLTEIFSEQQNLLHLNNNGSKNTLLFTNTETTKKQNY
jgi:hypothetical protein